MIRSPESCVCSFIYDRLLSYSVSADLKFINEYPERLHERLKSSDGNAAVEESNSQRVALPMPSLNMLLVGQQL